MLICTAKQQNKVKFNQVNAVINYIENNTVCKSKQLVSYFGETIKESCGICSVCITKKIVKTDDQKLIASKILSYLETQSADSRTLSIKLKLSESALLSVLKQLLEHKQITITKSNTYTLLP